MLKAISGAFSIGCAAVLLLSACSASPERGDRDGPARKQITQEELLREVDGLYRQARARLDAADFDAAILQYGMLKARFPFTDYAPQAQAELVYALYRNFKHEEAITESERFLREYPRHKLVPYVHYVRGLVFFERGKGFLDALPFVDPSRRDVSDARRAFDEFSLLTQRYPRSDYVRDARERMVYLRNRIAEHEMHVVRFYVERGAHLAATRRAQEIIAQYPGSPASYEALLLSEQSYRALGLQEQADEARRLIEANRARVAAALRDATPKVEPSRWYKPWTWFSGADRDRGEAPPALG